MASSAGLCVRAATPAPGCGTDWLTLAPKARDPVATLSLRVIVLLTMRTSTASCSAIPPPATPDTLLSITLLTTSMR